MKGQLVKEIKAMGVRRVNGKKLEKKPLNSNMGCIETTPSALCRIHRNIVEQ